MTRCQKICIIHITSHHITSRKLCSLINKVCSNKFKVISFDIFDTLLFRPASKPSDIFRIIGNKFYLNQGQFAEHQFTRMRTEAEQEARNCKLNDHDEITLNEIYLQLEKCFGFSHEQVEDIKNFELDTEEKLLYSRESIKEVFESALNSGKIIIITSDMYLPVNFIEKVLNKNNFTGYKKIYLSSEYKETKSTGKLFKRIIKDFERENIKPNEILHIGDNYYSDFVKAREAGLNAFLFPKAIDVFNSHNQLREIAENSNDNVFLIGTLANLLFDDPFIKYDGIANNSPENLGFVIAPFMLAFSKWILDDMEHNGIKKLFLAWRDGYLPLEIIKLLKNFYDPEISAEPIYLNRSVRYPICAEHEHPLTHLCYTIPEKMTVRNFIKYRLLIDDEKEFEEVLRILGKSGYLNPDEEIQDVHRIYRLTSELEKYLRKNGTEKIKIIREYCRDKIKNYEHVAIFDIGYRGAVANFMAEISSGLRVTGYQLLKWSWLCSEYLPKVNLKSCINCGKNVTGKAGLLHALMERILSSSEPGITEIIKRDGKFIKQDGKINIPHDNVNIIQENIILFCRIMAERFGENIKFMRFDPHNLFWIVAEILINPTKTDAKILRALSHSEAEFMGGSTANYFEAWFDGKFKNRNKFMLKKFLKFLGAKKIYNYFVPYSDEREGSKIKKLLKGVAEKFYLKDIAKKLHVKGIIRRLNKLNPNKFKVSAEEFVKSTEIDIKNSIDEIKNYARYFKRDKIIFIGGVAGYGRGICAFLNDLAGVNINYDWLFMSEYTSFEQVIKNVHMPVHILPEFFERNKYIPELDIKVTDDQKKLIYSSPLLNGDVEMLIKYLPNVKRSFIEYFVLKSYEYLTQVFKILKPKLIITWNEYQGLHRIVNCVAKELNMTVNYMETGQIPGTFFVTAGGQTGKSFPAKNYEEFLKLEITQDEIKNAQEVYKFLQSSKLNRYKQPENNVINNFKMNLNPKHPVILYTGELDYEAGLFPYDDVVKNFESPFIKSSNEAAKILGELALKNNWEIIYKIHPLMFGCEIPEMPKSVHIVKACNINDLVDYADLTITILSSTGYIALIREKPLIMLGYTSLRGKGCCYEAFNFESLEAVIKNALENKMTDEMKINFIKHIAQMNKYFLYDDNLPRKIRYGKRPEEFKV